MRRKGNIIWLTNKEMKQYCKDRGYQLPEVKRKMRWPWGRIIERINKLCDHIFDTNSKLSDRIDKLERLIIGYKSTFWNDQYNIAEMRNRDVIGLVERVEALENAAKPKCVKCKKIL